MPYLSKVALNPLRRGTQRMLNNPQVLHAAVLGGLSRQPVEERILWRLESAVPHRMDLLVLSRSKPSWEHLVEQGGWPASDDAQALVKPYEPLLDRIVRGREFAFRVRANPVTATRRPLNPSVAARDRLSQPRARGVRVPQRTVDQQLAWLLARVRRWGFELPVGSSGTCDARLVSRQRLSFRKHDGATSPVVIETATFEGRVRIVDAATARRSLLEGVGRARAYGCGLVTLAPLAPAYPPVGT